MGKTVVDELITLLTLEDSPGNDKTAKDFEDNLEDIQKTALKVGAALVTVASATLVAVAAFAKGVDEGAKFAKSIDLTYEQLQELEYAQRKAGGSTDALRGDLAKITQTMSSPIPGEFNQTLLTMGIHTRKANGDLKNAGDILGDLTKKFEGLDNKQAQQLGSKLGISQGTIRLLQKGTASLAELRKEAHTLGGIIPPQTAEDAEKFGSELTDARTAIGGLGADVGGQLLPAVTDLVISFREFVVANKEFIAMGVGTILGAIVKGFGLFLTILMAVARVLFFILTPLNWFIKGLDKVGALAPIVTAALLAMTAAMIRMAVVAAAGPLLGMVSGALKAITAIRTFTAMIVALRAIAIPAFLQMSAAAFVFVAPFLAIAAAVAALIIVLEDLWKFFSGGESVTGRVVDFVKGLRQQKGEDDETANGMASSSPGRRSAIPGSVVNNQNNRTTQGGDTTIHVHGAGDTRAVGADVANRAGMGRTSQILKPGSRASVVA